MPPVPPFDPAGIPMSPSRIGLFAAFPVCAILVSAILTTSVQAQVAPKMGAVGDSLLDEHFDQTGFSGLSLDYSFNAFELMQTEGRIDGGLLPPSGDWGGTRQTGYEYNWALAGSTTGDVIDDMQPQNLAAQMSSDGVGKAVMIVGSNNLFPVPPANDAASAVPGNVMTALNSDYEAIYFGVAPPPTIQMLADAAVNDVVAAANSIRAAGIDLVVATAPEYGITPFAKHFYPDPVGRARVDDVMESWNADAMNRLTTQVGVPVVDLYSMTKDIWGDHGSEKDDFLIGGVAIDLNGTAGVNFLDYLDSPDPMAEPGTPSGDTPDAFTHDGIHPNSVMNGMFANVFMTAFNQQYGDSFVLFSEQEILEFASLGDQYTGDTIFPQLGQSDYSGYVTVTAVPEPSSLLVTAGILGGVVARRVRRRRR